MNLNGTPIFVLGRTNPENPELVFGEVSLRGARPPEHFGQAMESLQNDGQTAQ